MEAPAIRKICTDSRHRTDVNDSHSNLRLRLSQTVNFSEDTVAVCDDMSLPNASFLVGPHAHYLFISEYPDVPRMEVRAVPLTRGRVP